MALHPLDALALDNVLIAAGFPKFDVASTTSPSGLYRRRTAWAKAMAESGGYYDIIGGPNPNGSYDYGLFQINEAVHRKGLGEENWAKILDPEYNASLAYSWSKQGADWSTWGLGLNGWAGSLHDTNPEAWSMIQQAFYRWYDKYPAEIAASQIIATMPGVHLSNLKFGVGPKNPDVTAYQTALRKFLTKINKLGTLNPHGVTGYYGVETQRMTDAVYRYQAAITHDLGWLRGDLTTPGPKMLNVIGLKAI
jgi:hypothetical protein